MSEIQGSSGTSSIANTAQQPAIYPAPCYSGPPRPKRHLNGNHDFLSIFGLMPLYDRVVRPYLRDDPAKVKAESVEAQVQAQGQRADSNAAAKEGKDSATAGTPAPSNDPGLPGNDTSQADAGKQKRLAMPKTFAHYVEDLPGKVKPPKRTAQISRDTVMRDQIFAPEKMAQRILPFERDVLDGAFAVQPGEVPGIDHNLLEPDEAEPTPKKKKKKDKKRKSRPSEVTSNAGSGTPGQTQSYGQQGQPRPEKRQRMDAA